MLSSHSVGYGISNFWYLFFISYLAQRKLLIQRTFALYEEKTFSTMGKYVSSLLLWHFLKSGIWILKKFSQNLIISKLIDSVKYIILYRFYQKIFKNVFKYLDLAVRLFYSYLNISQVFKTFYNRIWAIKKFVSPAYHFKCRLINI